jgi:hypothetical protein
LKRNARGDPLLGKMFYRNRVTQRYFDMCCWKLGQKTDNCLSINCDCDRMVKGKKGSVSDGFEALIPRFRPQGKKNQIRLSDEQMTESLFSEIRKNFLVVDDMVVRTPQRSWEHEIDNIIQKSPNMTRIKPPVSHRYVASHIQNELHPGIFRLFQALDRDYLKMKGLRYMDLKGFYENELELVTPIPSLAHLAFNVISPYKLAFGTYKGRPPVNSSSVNLENKVVEFVRQMSRDQEPSPALIGLIELVPAVKDLVYTILDTKKYLNTVAPKIDLMTEIDDMPLHTGAGINPGRKKLGMLNGVPIEINPRGKKRENLEASVEMIADFVEEAKKPFITWSSTVKYENVPCPMSVRKDDAAYAKHMLKMRMFVIPNLVCILMERMLAKPRMILEKKRIRIGHKWVWGGMDELFNILNPNKKKRMYFDGDFSKWDLSIRRILIEIYRSESMAYFDRSKDPDLYDIMSSMADEIAKSVIDRLQHIYADIWARVEGHVPSGAFETSIMNSWINLFLHCWFCVSKIVKMSPKQQKKAWAGLLEAVIYVVYGDDHVLSIDMEDPFWLKHFSYREYVDWLRDVFGMIVRDISQSHQFHSEVKDGLVIKRGIIFLKHYAVLNSSTLPGQATYLPWRSYYEILPKIAWGREPGRRDLIDVALSIIGHVYGTYASDRTSYDLLFCLWELLSKIVESRTNGGPLHLSVLAAATDRWDNKRFAQYGLSVEHFDGKFPTWETLVSKNVYIADLHSYTEVIFDS